MRTVTCFAALPFLVSFPVSAGALGEGHSSAKQGGPAELYLRAFTIVTGPEACAKSPKPVELRVYLNPLR